MSKEPLKRSDVMKRDPWDGTRWKVKVILPDGRHVLPYAGDGTNHADALRHARKMAHPAYAAKVYEFPRGDEQSVEQRRTNIRAAIQMFNSNETLANYYRRLYDRSDIYYVREEEN